MRGTLGIAIVVAVLGCGPLDVGGAGEGTASETGSTGRVSDSSTSEAPGTGVDTEAGTSNGDGGGTSTGSIDPDGDSSTGRVATDEGTSTTDGSTGTDEGSSSGSAASCDELYGAAPDYILCMETDTECHFNATTNGNCNDMCAMFMGTCVAAFDNPNSAGQECDIIEPNTDTCDTNRGTEICACSK